MVRYGLYLGCNMPAIRPDVEKAIRESLTTLGLDIVDIEGAACCPAFGTFYSVDETSALAVNAWNLAMAERLGVDLIAQCGSCYSTLKIGRHKILNGKLDVVNKYLAKAGVKYEGKSNVRHIIDIYRNVIGPEKIKNSLKYSLEGMKVVVQNPCHVLRPSKIVGFDDPERPMAFKEIVMALGAEIPYYEREKQCCGGAGGFSKRDKKANLEFVKMKFDSMKEEVDPDLIVVSCITCLMHMDNIQEEMKKAGMIDYQIPVFDYSQILAICLGKDPDKVARISTIPRDDVIKRILENKV
ncbi:Heterodisulfide reductase, subunit B [Archaeoglobus sulfaticallidus PM70-1]|uniref:Heterodisulfide reductase, subunit B n=1 Tax=Archaeoglobus sulfaticallidus PM70-1 TaxID=387631 RepID=N0BFI3_9EURY|nr:CoB--CoM heterodisulfide reductase iron-sulfur subunit B family protein [Archaeoglobus sulfaticallidus]AGK61793.1 Heterodisulfide reductase, subunit B [Archaeoglobus sulfaticallidus PM70-1]